MTIFRTPSEEMDVIPWARPALVGEEKEFVQDALQSSWISGGPYVELFEAELSKFLDVEHVSLCSNGTTAIELSLLALELVDRGEVVVPAFGYLAAANAAVRMGFRVVFADINPETWNVTPESVGAVITPHTVCVIAIHTYGVVCDMEGIIGICEPLGIKLIEDAAEAFGSRRAGQFAGTSGALGTFSFQATKTITTGEGGAVCSSEQELIENIDLFKSHGVKDTRYLHKVPGGNSRITNLQAAIGLAQLRKIDFLMEERRRVHTSYKELLEESAEFVFQASNEACDSVMWATGLRLADEWSETERDEMLEIMQNDFRIECRPGFYSASRHGYFGAVSCSQADSLAPRLLVLPGFVGMSEEQLSRVGDALAKTISQVRIT